MDDYFKQEQERSNYYFEHALVLSTVKGHLKGAIKFNESKEVVEFATMLLDIINEDLTAVEDKYK